ncbi:hypothetical protein H8356DRAFT_1436434 [Neocallimastix lanati (nom. inval.)]|nr:hypothetical protein H8356DRAFT_1436434 [Neocallimastix sp. JGI-2020a]
MKRIETEEILTEKQILVLELLQTNSINKLKDFIYNIKIPLYFLNSTNFDLLIIALSLNCSLDIVKLIFNNYRNNYKKSPLLVSLENSNFQIIKFLIEKGADIYYRVNGKNILEILREENSLTIKKLNFLLKNGFTLKKFKIERLSNFEFKYIKMCLENYVFDINFIKNLLNLYKNKNGISKRNFNHIINCEKNKVEIPRNLYLEYLDKKEYRKVEYLFKYYDTSKTTSFKDFILFYLNYFDRNFNKKPLYDFFNFIINNDNILPFSKEYAINENETIIQNKKLKMIQLIKNNDTLKLEAFLKKNNYILNCLYSNKNDILKLINECNALSPVVYILQNTFFNQNSNDKAIN